MEDSETVGRKGEVEEDNKPAEELKIETEEENTEPVEVDKEIIEGNEQVVEVGEGKHETGGENAEIGVDNKEIMEEIPLVSNGTGADARGINGVESELFGGTETATPMAIPAVLPKAIPTINGTGGNGFIPLVTVVGFHHARFVPNLEEREEETIMKALRRRE